MMTTIKKLVSRVEMMLAKAVIKAVNDTDDIQLVKISVLADETQDGIERLQNYGFSSVPPNGSEAFVAYLNGNRDHGVVLVIDNGEYRPRNLKDGEAVLYSQHGQIVLLDENGDYRFENGTDFGVAFNRLRTAFNQLQADYDALVIAHNTHVHLGVPHATSTVGAATVTGSASTANIDPSKVAKVRFP